jgi:hypothetical protein
MAGGEYALLENRVQGLPDDSNSSGGMILSPTGVVCLFLE